MFIGQGTQTGAQQFAHLGGMFHHSFFLHGINGGHNGSHRQRMARIRQAAGKHFVVKIIAQCGGNNHPARRHIAGIHAFGKGNQIGHHIIMFQRKPFASTAKARHHFIHNHDDAKLIAQGTHALHITRRRHHNTGGARHAFQQNGGNAIGPFRFNYPAQMV